MKTRSHNSILLCALSILLVFSIMLVMNILSPLVLDDFAYSYSFADGERITSLSQIIPSMAKHYYIGNGRLLTHSAVQACLMMSPVVFDIFNSLLFCAMLLLVCYQINGSLKTVSWHQILLSFVFVWLFAPSFGQPFLWLDGSMNYLLPATLLMLGLVPYRFFFKEYKKLPAMQSVALSFACLFLSFCIGYTSETVSVIFAVLQVLFCIAFLIKKYRLRIWMIFSFIGNAAGLLLMFSSPTYNQRSEIWGESSVAVTVFNSLKKIPASIKVMIYSLRFPIIVFAAVLILFFLLNRKKKISEIIKEKTDKILLTLIFLISTFAFGMFNCFCDYYPNRIWVPAVLFMFIAVCIILSEIKIKSSWFSSAIIIIFIAVFCLSCVPEIKSAKSKMLEYNDREQYVEEEKSKGNTDLELEPIISDSKYSVFISSGDISDAPENIWLNEVYAKYHGLTSVSLKK